MTVDLILNPSSIVTPLRPLWFLFATLTIPLGDKDIDTATQLALNLAITFRIQIQLYNLFNGRNMRKRRSIQEDQLDLFQQIEDNIAATGLDGHACVLRFICEMQANKFSHSSIFGEMLTLMFTPKPGDKHTILKEYTTAEMAGQTSVEDEDEDEGEGDTCSQQYYKCPVSVFTALRRIFSTYSTPADRPFNSTNYLQGVSEDDDL